ncbi:hypothetical protein [Calothrix sp. PCC 7507]|uniref:hypothetical protein n=1 Tax=Calothrix sp. PCC 7507 TaxID=99598 RepID=UPI00029F2E26|nr:hypothetical protein [Calothrix sp. PCC 7507]AFY34881.1 hypothetical protein Cal7507_4512 [Calothrix sp. PCC 7507]
MSKGGHTSGTWTNASTWQSGPTKTIRVPIALEQQIMAYARAIDSESASKPSIPQREGDIFLQFTLGVIDRYINWRQKNYRSTQNSRKPDLTARTWDELRKLRKLLVQNPEVLTPGAD